MRIIGVDAVAGAGLEAVEDGRINASFLYPTGGEQVIRTAMRIIQGSRVDKFIPLRTAPVDHQSARTLLLQADQLQNIGNVSRRSVPASTVCPTGFISCETL